MEGMFNIFTVYSLICVFLPCLLYQLVLVYQGRKSGKHCQAVSLIWTCIFLVYVWMVYEVTGIGLLADVLRTDIPLFSGRINLKPFAEAGIGYVLNVIMCMPPWISTSFYLERVQKCGKNGVHRSNVFYAY